MVEIISFEDSFYYPAHNLREGLETLVRFPDGEFKRNSIPNSTVWVYNPENHKYIQEILGNDVGCGIAAFLIAQVNPVEAADRFYEHLKDKGILGRGNHFVDVCSAIDWTDETIQEPPYNVLLLHTDGKSYDNTVPTTIREAQQKQENAKQFREQLGCELADLLGVHCETLGNWMHNSVEVADVNGNQRIIYRKGAIKVQKEKLYMLPEHLGAYIIVYTVTDEIPWHTLPPFSSMPHATGRKGPISQTKVSEEEFAAFRNMEGTPYIPEGIPNSSLRTEHPSCFNRWNKIRRALVHLENRQFVMIGQYRIWSYVGKI